MKPIPPDVVRQFAKETAAFFRELEVEQLAPSIARDLANKFIEQRILAWTIQDRMNDDDKPDWQKDLGA